MNVLDLFSGIGGFSLGLERAGMRTVAFCEIEPFARRVLAKHWPAVPILGDVRTVDFPDADIICGGFPCQDISLAGRRAGVTGERSGLYREVLRAIRVVRPKFAILENVAALLCGGMDTVLGDMAEIGVDAEWHCIPASAVGAPHRRDRVWIIADTRGEQHKGDRTPFSGEIAEELSRAAAAQAMGHSGCSTSERDTGAIPGEKKEIGGEDGTIDGDRSVGPEHASAGRASEQWLVEPDVGRVAHGVPARVDRLRGLGNAVVPQIPEIIGRAIMKREPR